MSPFPPAVQLRGPASRSRDAQGRRRLDKQGEIERYCFYRLQYSLLGFGDPGRVRPTTVLHSTSSTAVCKVQGRWQEVQQAKSKPPLTRSKPVEPDPSCWARRAGCWLPQASPTRRHGMTAGDTDQVTRGGRRKWLFLCGKQNRTRERACWKGSSEGACLAQELGPGAGVRRPGRGRRRARRRSATSE